MFLPNRSRGLREFIFARRAEYDLNIMQQGKTQMSQRLSCLISQVKMVLLVQHDWLTLFSGAGAMVSITQRPGAISYLISTISVAATGLILWADRPYMRAYSALGAVIFRRVRERHL